LEAAYQLDTNDAEFVDVMHTSSVASLNPIGHVDFYPNGGIQQPGCPDPDTGNYVINYEFKKHILIFCEKVAVITVESCIFLRNQSIRKLDSGQCSADPIPNF
jgi:hypothetical protein